MVQLSSRQGRNLFALDAQRYHQARPGYPSELYEFLQQTTGLSATTEVLEIGAGSGLASQQLLAMNCQRLTLLEPDPGFMPLLQQQFAQQAKVEIVSQAFEDWQATKQHYDLIASATAYHWLDPKIRVAKIAALLKPGGWLALWWNVFGDPDKTDHFHDATHHLLKDLPISPSAGKQLPFALDKAARQQEFADQGLFGEMQHLQLHWTLTLNPIQVADLYSTYSNISNLPAPQRQAILAQLAQIAKHQFNGEVIRNMRSIIYLWQRLP